MPTDKEVGIRHIPAYTLHYTTGLRCEWGAGVLNLVLSLSLSHTGHWKFNMAPHGKELSEDLKKIIVALHKDGVAYKKITKTLKLSCSTVAKTIQWFNRTGSTQNRPRHLGDRCMK